MPSITITPLNNGITTAGTLNGICPLNFGSTTSYLYYDSLGDIYLQLNISAPATLLLSTGLAITCKAAVFDGTVFSVFLGGTAGNYVYGTIDSLGVSTLSSYTYGVDDFTAVTFDLMAWAFTCGTTKGDLVKFDISSSLFTPITQLTTQTLPVGTSLIVKNIYYDLTLNKYLIITMYSSNVQTHNIANISVSFFGTLDNLVYYNFIGWNLHLCTMGILKDANGIAYPKLIVAGEDCKFYHSTNGTTWTVSSTVDQQIPVFSLTFNKWVFVAGLAYGIILLSTNGNVWESAYDALLSSDIIDVKND